MGTYAAAPGIRDYDAIINDLHVAGDFDARLRGVVDLLWDRLADTGVSWVGFYVKAPHAPEMTLTARRDKPACSPIGLQGACGRAWTSRKSLVVTDVARLGAGYIACDPRDRAEVVVPVLRSDGACWGVLDLDSYRVNAFGPEDAAGLCRVLRFAGVAEIDPLGVEIV